MEPASSWLLVRFASAEPWRELPGGRLDVHHREDGVWYCVVVARNVTRMPAPTPPGCSWPGGGGRETGRGNRRICACAEGSRRRICWQLGCAVRGMGPWRELNEMMHVTGFPHTGSP